MDVMCKLWSISGAYGGARSMSIETLDEGKGDTIIITIRNEKIYVDWHELADTVDILGRVLGKGQGCIDREERL